MFNNLREYTRTDNDFQVDLGEYDVDISFSPKMIRGSDKLIQACGGIWPSFHEAIVTILSRSSEKIVLRFSEGFLNDIIVNLSILDIVSEDYGQNSLEYFTEQWVTQVEFSNRNNYMEITLHNDYKECKLPKGMELSDFANYEHPDVIPFIEEEFIN